MLMEMALTYTSQPWTFSICVYWIFAISNMSLRLGTIHIPMLETFKKTKTILSLSTIQRSLAIACMLLIGQPVSLSSTGERWKPGNLLHPSIPSIALTPQDFWYISLTPLQMGILYLLKMNCVRRGRRATCGCMIYATYNRQKKWQQLPSPTRWEHHIIWSCLEIFYS